MRYFDQEEKMKKEKHLAENPKWIQRCFNRMNSVHDIYEDLLLPYVKKDNVILDAGCGKKGIMNKYSGKFKRAVGIDLSPEAIKINKCLDEFVVGNLENLPFPDGSFDIIISQWVVEHMENPEKCYREFFRVLKKGGGLILVTNSIHHPIMCLSSIFPEGIRDRLKKRVLPSEIEEDTFPTYYKSNSLPKMRELLGSAGFTKVHDAYVGDPSFFIYSKFLFLLLLVYEKITDISFLKKYKMHVVVHYAK
jgi:ubiquinone/menaquinone biosynthesis C-methylase UbiE